MWFGINLQRSYKYIMYATKSPSLRIDQSDLKCKNGCDFYGNAQWQGYCSKCHREHMQRQRRAEKVNASSSDSPKSISRSESKLKQQTLDIPQKTTQIGFAKFEEKRLRKNDSLKKTNILKMNMFRKGNKGEAEKESHPEKVNTEWTIPVKVSEAQKKDFHRKFPSLGDNLEKDTRKFVQAITNDIMKHCPVMTIDELSERIQHHYQTFIKRMDNNQPYAELDSDVKELLIDFIESHTMSYLHSFVFSPSGTDDERADAKLRARIRQLGWVSPTHLECRVTQTDTATMGLLYNAINELIAMDSVRSPGGKLLHVVSCCRSVVGVASAHGRPASADDLLPALIFAVLRANPPRLVSNINYVTRFCNAARLMTGEGGYYFTNLCCAVSFIENLTAESLSMDKKEFDCYMSMPATIGGSSWVAALSLCEGLHESVEQSRLVEQLNTTCCNIQSQAKELLEFVEDFEEEISRKVAEVLSRTPLQFKERKILPHQLPRVPEQLVDLEIDQHAGQAIRIVESLQAVSENERHLVQLLDENSDVGMVEDLETPSPPVIDTLNLQQIQDGGMIEGQSSPTQNQGNSLSTSQLTRSTELLTPSPVFAFGSLSSRSVDELATPEEFNSENFMQGLSNVNYDIDLSDFSAENSVTEDDPLKRDPFSPEGTAQSDFSQVLTPVKVDQLIDINTKDEPLNSILDENDGPASACLLPPPIIPITNDTTLIP